MKIYAIASLLFLLSIVSITYADVGSAYIYVPAVTGVTTGTLTKIQLNVTLGDGAVMIKGPTNVSGDTYQSATTASFVGSNYSGVQMNKYNFTFTIFDNASGVSGPSGGFAMTLLAISALSHRPLVKNFSATGTIANDGSVGQIGGVYDKAGAVKAGGMNFFLVPTASSGSTENLIYYLSQQHYNLTMVEIGNVSQGIPYAFGSSAPKRLTFNVSDNNTIVPAPPFNQSCTGCTFTQFGGLVNATFNFTIGELDNLTGNYSAFKQQMLDEINNYGILAGKGYLYAAANLGFMQYLNIFVLANQNSLTESDAGLVISSVSNYCSSLTPPLMTNTNYEYVVGGELRQTWANITLNDSTAALAQVQTSDDIAGVLHQAGSAYAWCLASGEMYNIAAGMSNSSNSSSSYVDISRSAISQILAKVQAASNLPSSLYSRAALQDYKMGWYAPALYGAEYTNAFDNQSVFGNYNRSQLIAMTDMNIANSTYGIWPYEFGAEANFYLFQASTYTDTSAASSMINNAYLVSVLSSSLGDANMFLNSSFVQVNIANASIVASIASIQTQISQLYIFLTIMMFLLFVMFLMLLVILIKQHSMQNSMVQNTGARSTGQARRRSQRGPSQ